MLEEIRFYLEQTPDKALPLAVLAVACVLLLVVVLRRGKRSAWWNDDRPPFAAFFEIPLVRRASGWIREKPDWAAFGVGIACLLATAALLVQPVRLLMRGAGADGIVTSVVETTYDDADHKTRISSTATIRFRAGDRDMTIQRSTSREFGSTCIAGCFHKGERLKILYLAEDPNVAEVRSFPGLFGAPFVPGVVAALAFLFAWLLRSQRAGRAAGIRPPS